MKRIRLLHPFTLLAVITLVTATGAPGGTVAASDAPTNDTTQARLRVSQCVLGEPNMDVYLNGTVPVDAGIPRFPLEAFDASGYEYLAPGTYSLTVVPSGQDLSKPFFGPLDVPVVAGHRYTVVVLGQKDDASHQALVIDETTAYQAIGAKPTDAAHITVNNVEGVPGIDFSLGGVVRDKNAPYGGFAAAIWPGGFVKGLAITVSGSPDKVLNSTTDELPAAVPGSDFLDCFGGTYPGSMGKEFSAHSSASTSTLNTIDLLQLLSDDAKHGGSSPSFSTFLTALKTTGLTDMLANGGPYMILPPTDEAFAALPQDQQAALLADPQALADMLRGLIVAGYYPPGSLSAGVYRSNRTVTNLLGQPLAIQSVNGDSFTINDQAVGRDFYIMTANGGRVFYAINEVPMLAPSTMGSSPGMPTTGAGTNLVDLIAVIVAALAVLLVGGLLRQGAAYR